MKDHGSEAFKGLMDSSVRVWHYKLDKQVISQGATSLDRFRAFKIFISIDLAGMPFDEWEVFVNNEVAKKFQLKSKDIKTTVAEITKGKHHENRNDISNQEGEETDEKTETEDRLSKYPEKAEEERTIFIQKLSEESGTTVTPCNSSVISEGVTLKPRTIDRINTNVTLNRKNVIQGNCDNTFSRGMIYLEIKTEKLVVPYSENMGYSVTLNDKSCHLNIISKYNSTALMIMILFLF